MVTFLACWCQPKRLESELFEASHSSSRCGLVPKRVTKRPKTQNPEKPSEGGLSLGGEGVMQNLTWGSLVAKG